MAGRSPEVQSERSKPEMEHAASALEMDQTDRSVVVDLKQAHRQQLITESDSLLGQERVGPRSAPRLGQPGRERR